MEIDRNDRKQIEKELSRCQSKGKQALGVTPRENYQNVIP